MMKTYKVIFGWRIMMVRFFLVAILPLAFACNNKWKKPAELTFYSKINTTGGNGFFAVTESGAVIEAISFNGNRKQGKENIVLEKKFENGLPVKLDDVEAESGISMDVPQGTYNQITVLVKMKSVNNAPSFLIQGYFNNPDENDTVNFRVEYYSEDYIEFILTKSGESGGVNLMEGIPSRATLSYNSTAWFLALNTDMLNHAELTVIDGKQTIVISPVSNTDIYALVVNGIKTGNEVVIE